MGSAILTSPPEKLGLYEFSLHALRLIVVSRVLPMALALHFVGCERWCSSGS